MRRRDFIKAGSAAAVSMLAPRLLLAAGDDGTFELEAVEGDARLYGDAAGASRLWLYNGRLPGPEIRVKKGASVRVRFTNRLRTPTSIHWHGIRIANAMDGVSGLTQDPVAPGDSFIYDFIAPVAGTYWYHAHHESWNQVPRGLFGPLIIDDADPVFDRDHDITLVLSDWLLDETGVFHHQSLGAPMHWSHAGRLGNWLTVNGVSLPNIPLRTGDWYRLRLINASTARVLDIEPGRFGAEVVGFDGQTLDAPRKPTGVMQLAPAQRMDLVTRFKQPGRVPFEMMTGEAFAFAHFVVQGQNSTDARLPMPERNELPEPDLQDAKTLPLVMQGGAMGRLESLTYKGEVLQGPRFRETRQFWGFNGVAGLTEEPYFRAERGRTVAIELENQTAFPHGIHLHGHHFRVWPATVFPRPMRTGVTPCSRRRTSASRSPLSLTIRESG